jgi:protein CpxP
MNHSAIPVAAKATTPNLQANGRRWFTSLAALGGLALLSSGAVAQGMGGGMERRRGPASPEDMARRLDERISRMMRQVGGTPEQKDKLVAIASSAMKDLRPMREQHRAARQKGMSLLAAPQIDRAALEQVRASEMQLADQMSRRTLQSMADAAEVLTPEQRAKLAERMKHMGHRRHWG